MQCAKCGYPADGRVNGKPCPECGSTAPPTDVRLARRSHKWWIRALAATLAAAPIAAFAIPDYVHVLKGGVINGWAFVGLTMISPIIVVVSGLVVWLIVGLTVRGCTGGRIGLTAVGEGVLLSLPLQFVMIVGLTLCPSGGGC